jgi:pimeloyl-ACP methyl ester carboxylesterase
MNRLLPCGPAIVLFLLFNCSPKEKTPDFTDPETTEKDDAFREGIKTGSFVRLPDGYTYYEYDNRQADTILVFVHGFSVPSYIWDSTMNAAKNRGYGALRYDTYGRGSSDNPDVAYDVALFSRQLTNLLDTLQIKTPVNLLGLSDGGRTITAFAYQHPERVKNLIYVDAAGFNAMGSDGPASRAVSDEEIVAFKKEQFPGMASGQMGDFYDSLPFAGWDRRYEKVMHFKGFARALISTGKNRGSLEKEHRVIAASSIPVSAIWGEEDQVVKLKDVRANLLDRIPKLKLYVIPNAGHLPHMEQTKAFNAILFDQILKAK